MHGLSKREIQVTTTTTTTKTTTTNNNNNNNNNNNQELYPIEHEKRLKDKLNYRYPGNL